jgi:carbon storage regulator
VLVLTRRPNETIIITPPGCEPIRIVVVEVRGDKARLGIEAPRQVTVHRQEVQDAIDRQHEGDAA